MTNVKKTKRKAKKRRVAKCIGNEAGIGCTKEARTEAKEYRCAGCRAINKRLNVRVQFIKSSLFNRVRRLVDRAGTVETFDDVQALDDWFELGKLRNLFSAIEDTSWHVAHLFPVAGLRGTGKTNRWNCIVAEEVVNKRLSNSEVFTKAVEGVHFIGHEKLDRDLRVVKGLTSNQEVVDKLERHLGKQELYNWLESKTLTEPSKVDEDAFEWLEHVEATSKFLAMLGEFRGDGNHIEVEHVIDFEVAFTSYLLGFKGSKSVAYLKLARFGHDERLDDVASLVQDSLLSGESGSLLEATEKLKGLTEEAVKI